MSVLDVREEASVCDAMILERQRTMQKDTTTSHDKIRDERQQEKKTRR